MKRSYGDPPVLIIPLFLKIFALVMLIVVGVALGGLALDRPVGRVDLVGMTITAPVLAYLIHLWLAPSSAEAAEKDKL